MCFRLQDLTLILLLFQLFIAACGLSHLAMMTQIVFANRSSAWFSMSMKAGAAIISLYTAIILPNATQEVADKIYNKVEKQLTRERRLETERTIAVEERKIADEINQGTTRQEVANRMVQATVEHIPRLRVVALSAPLISKQPAKEKELIFSNLSFSESTHNTDESLNPLRLDRSVRSILTSLRLDVHKDRILSELDNVLTDGTGCQVSPMTAAFLLGPNAPLTLLNKLAISIPGGYERNFSSRSGVPWSQWHAYRVRIPASLFGATHDTNNFAPGLQMELPAGFSVDESFGGYNILAGDQYTYAMMLVCLEENQSTTEASRIIFQDVANYCSKAMEQVHMLEQERDRLKELAEMERRKRKANDTFLSMISHELRTPLHAILGYTELLLDLAPTQEQTEYLNTIANSGSTLCELLNDVLDLTK